MKYSLSKLIPFGIGIAVATITYASVGWWGFWLVFPWIGGWITIGNFLAARKKGKKKDIGRRVSILAASPIFLVFLGVIQHENLQLEETVFYLYAGVFSRVLIHYAIAKIFGPLIWGRGFCGWACWTAAILDWLPIKGNKPIAKGYTWLRYPVLAASLLLPWAFIQTGYNYTTLHIDERLGKFDQLIWFLVGNALYYIVAIALSFVFKKKRAFCKIACPVSLVMTPTTALARLKRRPSGEECNGCEACNKQCPMDVDVMTPIMNGKPVTSTECIYCGICKHVCPTNAIK
ncbi:MAG: 4Fe-4S ferredoxin [Deltaproteobacteria bacterium RIFOXYA12_FULL_58_15]|nr:MAG: 4Fe-4S ferredoxin [Deltaproteobacteria bacterium RIFOXYA12_FULL_58_15]OGR07321.1 MAG: 4Fe-4S ferredoxin [Deltaproteobacteria bacterium RIFOXYB12_FULL_58_9]